MDGSSLNQDSGYNSPFDLEFCIDAESSYYQQMMNEFEAEGVLLSNPSSETKAISKQSWKDESSKNTFGKYMSYE